MKPAPACTAALTEASVRWPNRSRASDGICGDARHQAKKSDHNPDQEGYCCAFDLTHDPDSGVDCNKLSRLLVAKKDQRVKYIIWNKQICNADNWAWRVYSGSNPHTKHMHVSIKQTARFDTNSWWEERKHVMPRYNPPLAGPIVDHLKAPNGGVWCLTQDAAIYAFDAPDYGAPNRHPEYWPPQGGIPRAARLEKNGDGYTVIAESGERFSYQ